MVRSWSTSAATWTLRKCANTRTKLLHGNHHTMIELSIGFIVASFFAGLITFLAPCTLPLVPAYLGFISGVDQDALKNPKTAGAARRKIFLNGVAFIVGFSAVFIIFGTLAGLAGQALVPYRIWLARIGGVLVILFGLFM